MTANCEVLIIGAGPGGLACARKLSDRGISTLVLERKKQLGNKVCAGGITWDGLIKRVPENLIERSFASQHIFSNRQKICIRQENPIIATVNRYDLGQHMAKEALGCGAKILTDTRVVSISADQVTAVTGKGETLRFKYKHLIGADGSTSAVRRYLKLPSSKIGVGINYQLSGVADKMEWHLNKRYFGYGYGWIFPHKNTFSIGAYSPAGNLAPRILKQNLLTWAAEKGYDLSREKGRAELINYDFQGFQFGNTWLVGDAAGLASGLTGEGIYPAILSGETVAQKIIDPNSSLEPIHKMVNKQKKHQLITDLAAKNRFFGTLLMEVLVIFLRTGLITFESLEMAN